LINEKSGIPNYPIMRPLLKVSSKLDEKVEFGTDITYCMHIVIL
jgi:hypothetical protein